MRKENINSILIALAISHTAVMEILSTLTNIDNIFVLYMIGIGFFTLLNNKFKIKKYYIFITLLCINILLIKLVIYGANYVSINYMLYFIICGVIPMYLVVNNWELKKVSKIVLCINILWCFQLIGENFLSYTDQRLMGITYGMLPGIMISILVLFKLIKLSKKLYFYLSIFILGFDTIYIMNWGSRGAFVCMGIFCILTYIYTRRKKITKIVYCIVSGISIFYISNYMDKMIIGIQQFLLKFNISILAIDKSVWQLKARGDMTTGRTILYNTAKEMINNKILFGGKIGAFEISMGIYPHNIFYQILLEMGILVLIFICIALVWQLYYIIFLDRADGENKIVLIILFSSSIIQLLFTSTYWKEVKFWMLLMLSIKYYIENKKYTSKRIIGESNE